MADVAPSTRSNTLLWALLGLLGVGAVVYFYVAPQRSAVLAVRADSLAAAEDIDALQERVSTIVALGTTLEGRAADLKRLDLAVPQTDGSEDLLVALSDSAERSGVVVTAVAPAVSTSAGGHAVTVTVRGSYGGVRLFVGTLTDLVRPIAIDSLTFSATAELAGGSLMNATLELRAAALGTAQSPSPASTPDATPGAANE